MYKVTALVQAGIQLQESVKGMNEQATIKPELNDEYIQFFRRMGKGHGRQQEGWHHCMSSGEMELLAEYVCSDQVTGPDEMSSLMSVLIYSGEFEYVKRLYELWLDKWNVESYNIIFETICNNDILIRKFNDEYKISPRDILDNIKSKSVDKYYGQCAGRDCDGSYNEYSGALLGYGLNENCSLYKECMKRYMFICNGKSYMEMGVERVTAFLEALDIEDKQVMIHNMLKVMDEFQLRTFVSLVPLFRSIIGNKDTHTYKDIVETLPEVCQDRYNVMQNQYLIYNVLGDNDRAAFWMLYADKGTIKVNEPTNTLFLEFPKFTVIEFGNAEAAYFFNNEYMDEKIINYIKDIDDEEQLERWLYENTEWSLDKEHDDHWRKAHVGNWQTDMKSYMSHNLRK